MRTDSDVLSEGVNERFERRMQHARKKRRYVKNQSSSEAVKYARYMVGFLLFSGVYQALSTVISGTVHRLLISAAIFCGAIFICAYALGYLYGGYVIVSLKLEYKKRLWAVRLQRGMRRLIDRIWERSRS